VPVATSPMVGVPVAGAPVDVNTATPTTAAPQTAPQNPPPPDNAAHLQLRVPENAEVFLDGAATTQTGAVREFVSPPLTPGKRYTYVITVRSTDATGKVVNDRRPIHVRANDWFSIDFTRPPPAEALPPGQVQPNP
jgi:uncharacterized protein (TIGR03000 family)